MTCQECKDQRKAAEVPFIAHESAMARAESSMRRLWIVVLLLIVLLGGTHIAWLVYDSQFEEITTTQEVTQEAENGTNNQVL